MYMPLRNTCARMLATRVFNDDTPALPTESRSTTYAIAYRHQLAPGNEFAGTVRAISAETGETVWLHEQRAGTLSLVATGGGLVFGGDVNGRFRAFDQETGEVLWEINLGSPVSGFPISYAVDGRAVHRGRHRHRGDVVALQPADPGTASELGQQSLRVRAGRIANGCPQESRNVVPSEPAPSPRRRSSASRRFWNAPCLVVRNRGDHLSLREAP